MTKSADPRQPDLFSRITDHEIFQGLNQEIVRKFLGYHAQNPDIYVLFKKFSFELLEAGRKHYSAQAIVERIRWHYAIDRSGSDDFKINNNYRPCYARLLILENPIFEGFFELRSRQDS